MDSQDSKEQQRRPAPQKFTLGQRVGSFISRRRYHMRWTMSEVIAVSAILFGLFGVPSIVAFGFTLNHKVVGRVTEKLPSNEDRGYKITTSEEMLGVYPHDYARIEQGKTYEFRTWGFPWPTRVVGHGAFRLIDE